MNYEHTLFEGRLIKRYKRFMADIEKLDGSKITIHCPNTGSMKNCLYPGNKIWYSDSGNPKRKYPCTWELAEIPVTTNNEERMAIAGMNTGRANPLVEELLGNLKVPELSDYNRLKREVRYGHENSRIDFLLQAENKPDCYVEVKSVTLAKGDGLGLFPDAVTTRGLKHLRELICISKEGKRAVLFFCVQNTGINRVAPADDIDAAYGQELRRAANSGVDVIAWGATMSPQSISLTHSMPVIL